MTVPNPVLGITDVSGHVVIAYTHVQDEGNGYLQNGVAICVNPDADAYHPYVVWILAFDHWIGQWVASNGDYCENIEQALIRYMHRGGE